MLELVKDQRVQPGGVDLAVFGQHGLLRSGVWAGLSKGFTLLMRGRGDAAAAAKLMQKVAEQELARLQAGSLGP